MSEPSNLATLRVLVVDDEPDIRLGLSRLMKRVGVEATEAASGQEALTLLRESGADLVLTDLMMPGMTGAELLSEVKRRYPEVPVVILTAFGTVATAVSCLQEGAAHFLTKPFSNDEVQQLVLRLGRQVLARREIESGPGGSSRGEILVEDPRMKRVWALVARVSKSPVPVLIEGESGSGKEVVARTLHEKSLVKDRPFLAVNAAALTDTLLESELFGHRRGSFTGADRDRKGLFEEARGGTVFLDEVSSMSPAFQGKLLRVVQEKVVRPVGASADVPVEFRLVTATNRDLIELVKSGQFREDLYYRLRVVSIHVPPLRERREDIVPLANLFLSRAAAACLPPGEPVPELSDDAVEVLREHPWPGNVRELENAMQRAAIVCCGGRILSHHLSLVEPSWGEDREARAGELDYGEAKKRTLERFQRDFVQRALQASNGNVSRAAEACGLTRAAFQKILRQQGIDRRSFSSPD